ncbi:MAG: DUF5665 domain-containing protein [Candidatus Levybacteria bacterium]|nr:DUF5665 domain-containing protein [Candidatus Levybacteria bacterium]
MEKYEEVGYKNRKRIFIDNLLGGIAWGLGATVGISILLAIFGIVVSKINLIPIVGGFIVQTFNYISQTNPNLIK